MPNRVRNGRQFEFETYVQSSSKQTSNQVPNEHQSRRSTHPFPLSSLQATAAASGGLSEQPFESRRITKARAVAVAAEINIDITKRMTTAGLRACFGVRARSGYPERPGSSWPERSSACGLEHSSTRALERSSARALERSTPHASSLVIILGIVRNAFWQTFAPWLYI